MSNSNPKFLNRFTKIPFLIDLLLKKKLTLLNPSLWEDGNDRFIMELYRKRENKESLFALCLTDSRETIHHWNAFADGESGCCIEFNYNKLCDCIKKVDCDFYYQKIEYKKIKDLATNEKESKKFPFLKRDPFRPEKEFRIVALCNTVQTNSFSIPITLDTINRITLSNKLPKEIFENVKNGLNIIAPEFKGKISHSTLFNNVKWIGHFEEKSGN